VSPQCCHRDDAQSKAAGQTRGQDAPVEARHRLSSQSPLALPDEHWRGRLAEG